MLAFTDLESRGYASQSCRHAQQRVSHANEQGGAQALGRSSPVLEAASGRVNGGIAKLLESFTNKLANWQ